MNPIWWGQEAGPEDKPRLRYSRNQAPAPVLVDSDAALLRQALEARIGAYTPEWTNRQAGDPGSALIGLYASQAMVLRERLNRLPEKAFTELLRLAGIDSLPARPAGALLTFKVAAGAGASVLVPRGFQVQAPAADGGNDPVVFETDRQLYAAPASLIRLSIQTGTILRDIEQSEGVAEEAFTPFGTRPVPGNALLIGLEGEAVPGPTLSLGIAVATPGGTPPPVSAGGDAVATVEAVPFLRWELLDGGGFDAVEVVYDETGGLTRGGLVELRLPRKWRPGIAPGDQDGKPLRWLRLRYLYGAFSQAPLLLAVRLNIVTATAARAFRDEALEPVPGSRGRRWNLSQTPVLPGSLILEVDESVDSAEVVPVGTERPVNARVWRQVPSLDSQGPGDRVYTLDPATGEVAFGDNLHGKTPPAGFRNIRARIYRVGGGRAGAVAEDTITTLINSAPFITGVSNPQPAFGGVDGESREDTLHRGPAVIRARGRAVALADYALLAQQAPGADIRRAHAVSGLHPGLPGLPVPGVVGLFVVPQQRDEGPPVADEDTLRAVATWLQRSVAPVGVEIVAAAPAYLSVRAEVTVLIAPSADVGATVRHILDVIDSYLHPLEGGEDGRGWPFEETLRHNRLVRRLLERIPGLLAISVLNLVVAGVRRPSCSDVPLPVGMLFWAADHQVVPRVSEVTS